MEQTFLQFVDGKCPQTILTDIDTGLQESIRSELPSTKHIISVWYILPKLSGWFSLLLGSSFADFRSEFDVLYRMESAEQFEFEWTQMVARFELESEKHSSLLFSLRESWALSYVRGYFLAQMATSAYSKCVDMFLKGIINKRPCLRSFFDQVYEKLLFMFLSLH